MWPICGAGAAAVQPLLQGWLMKQPPAVFFKNWRRRWITLAARHRVARLPIRAAKGLPAGGTADERLVPTNTPMRTQAGTIASAFAWERELVLQCPNEFETRAWKEAIDGAIQTASAAHMRA